ncbi:MAG: glutamate--tRNA ligase [Coprobacillus sp.]|nr:glutamate--tRNA ligase [Coprobacillus sp.]
MVSDKELANIIFPEVTMTVEDLEKKYPSRNLMPGAEVTRFAPSPTGFLHTGSLFTAMICRKVATQSGGVFFLRLEDTDTKREIENSKNIIVDQLQAFNVIPDEGFFGDKQIGNYGPYVQSERADIYKVIVKHLISIGRAYPCFCTQEELNEIRAKQEEAKIIPGYYGQFAKYRFINNDERVELIKSGKPFVIRFKSLGNHIKKIRVHDLIHGDFDIASNDQDIVIFKSDGLPTYHFAHVVDDHFMRTTTVIRGEEWIASLPIHLDLFSALGWEPPKYAHLPLILKQDEDGKRRKLSKRLDAEAAVSFFLEEGYPTDALIMYLMTIANSNFEEWIFAHHFRDMDQFEFSFDKVSLEGALFDMGKLNFFSREVLATLNKTQITYLTYEYAKKYNFELKNLIDQDRDYFEEIMNIERERENPRKDYAKYSEIYANIAFFYDNLYANIVKDVHALPFNFEKFSIDTIKTVLSNLEKSLTLPDEESAWFEIVKKVGQDCGFAANNKQLKESPDSYIGVVADVAEMLRISLTGRKNAPNLYSVMKILGLERSKQRIDRIIALL